MMAPGVRHIGVEGEAAATPIYQPLDDQRQEIRLIEILSNEEPLICKLSVVSLLDKPRYSALSYVWGDAADKENIIIDGTAFPVTTNLKAALKHVGKHWKTFHPNSNPCSMRIWADAVCINQNDTDEIRSQVRLMERVYSCPESVMAWLGNEDQKTRLALEMLCQLAVEFFQAKYDQDTLSDLEWLKNHPYLWEMEERMPDEGKSGYPVWDAIFYLNMLPYWRRVWTLQEQVLAPTLIFSCPSRAVNGHQLFYAIHILGSLKAQLVKSQSIPDFFPLRLWRLIGLPGHASQDQIQYLVRIAMLYSTMYRAGSLRQTRRDCKRVEIERFECLVKYPFEATKPKDHVYGILGLFSPLIRSELLSYHSNQECVRSLYIRYTSSLLEESKRLGSVILRFLYLAGTGNSFSRSFPSNFLSLPSWVPDYQAASRRVWQPSWDTFQKLIPVEDLCTASVPRIDRYVLAVSGARCMAVSRLGPNFSSFFSAENKPAIAELLRDSESSFGCIHSFFRHALGIMNEDYVEDLWHFVLLLEFVQTIAQFLGEYCPSYLQEVSYQNTHGIDRAFNPDFSFDQHRQTVSPQMSERARIRVSSALEMHRSMVAFQTEGSFLGVGPIDIRERDLVFCLMGFPSFAVLREAGSQYTFVGPCNISETTPHRPGTVTGIRPDGGFRDVEIV